MTIVAAAVILGTFILLSTGGQSWELLKIRRELQKLNKVLNHWRCDQVPQESSQER